MCVMWIGLFISYVYLFKSRSDAALQGQEQEGIDGAHNLGVICALAAMHCCAGFTDGIVMTQILDRLCTVVARSLRWLVNGRSDEGYLHKFDPLQHRQAHQPHFASPWRVLSLHHSLTHNRLAS
jgi:hypothetical protein